MSDLEAYAVDAAAGEGGAEPVAFTFEGNIFEAADAFFEAKQARLAADKVAAELKVKEKQLEDYLIRELNHQEAAQGVVGTKVKIVLKKEMTPVVNNWDDFYKWVRETNSFEFLQRRLNTKPVKERWAEKESVPGIGEFPTYKLSVTKAK